MLQKHHRIPTEDVFLWLSSLSVLFLLGFLFYSYSLYRDSDYFDFKSFFFAVPVIFCCVFLILLVLLFGLARRKGTLNRSKTKEKEVGRCFQLRIVTLMQRTRLDEQEDARKEWWQEQEERKNKQGGCEDLPNIFYCSS